jgi:hypothetical protein
MAGQDGELGSFVRSPLLAETDTWLQAFDPSRAADF